MASPLSLLIGLRFSRGRRRGGMVSLISVISTIGIALGVAVLIVGLSTQRRFCAVFQRKKLSGTLVHRTGWHLQRHL